MTDALPSGLTVVEASIAHEPEEGNSPARRPCAFTSSTVTCSAGGTFAGESGEGLVVNIIVTVTATSGTEINEAEVKGGGAPSATVLDPVTFSSADPPFGPEPPFGLGESFYSGPADAAGATDSQAGDHPNLDTTGLVFDSELHPSNLESGSVIVGQEPKDVVTDLPPGFLGDPQAAPACSQETITTLGKPCPPGSVIGTVAFTGEGPEWFLSEPSCTTGLHCTVSSLYNVTPEHGYAAEFGFRYAGIAAVIYAKLVHTRAGYVVRVIVPAIPRAATLTGVALTFFGDPAQRDGGGTPTAFLTNPTDCAAPGAPVSVHTDSWPEPAPVPLNPDGSSDFDAVGFQEPQWVGESAPQPQLTGCEQLQFHPSIEVQPTSQKTGAPSGLNVDLRIPQNPDPNGLATPPLKNTTVMLPRGLAISPSSANGLAACSDAQIALESTEPATCPEASAIGTVKVHTPLLAEELEGRVFVGTPQCGVGGICTNADAQDGRMVRLFIEIANPARGVDVKLPGTVSLNPGTGQLTASFQETPQLPFDNLEFQFKSGERAPLSTPAACGSYASSVDLAPWSAPYTPDAFLSPGFNITEGCGAQGFAPAFTAGTVNPQAGAYSPLTFTLARSDSQQDLDALEATLPPGLLAKLAGVPRCGDAEANAGTCPESTRIGTITVAAGPGSDPYTVTGRLYLTVAYNGGPFGAVAEVPAIAGPFNLGTVVVRSSIRINPSTAQATVVSDPFPQILDGIPLQVRTVNVTLERAGGAPFTLNPTSCAPLAITGKLLSTQGAVAGVSSPFQATDCASLAFKPAVTISTQGRAGKAAGASLTVKVRPVAGQANTAKFDIELPKQLPARLTTLQKACTSAQFDSNPAGCPAASDIGTAKAITPVLDSPLEGPAYLVSHGGAAFPDVELILQGEGVTVYLDGKTQIKKGVTYSHFETVPDAPFTSFEATLPEGRYSILGANLPAGAHYSFCGQKLSIPTSLTGQNGAVDKQTTKVSVTGCPRTHPKAKRTAKNKAKKASRSTRRVGK